MPRELHFLKSPPTSIVLRFQKVQAHNKEINLSNSSGMESQAAKRQKLEGGLLRKVCKSFFLWLSNNWKCGYYICVLELLRNMPETEIDHNIEHFYCCEIVCNS